MAAAMAHEKSTESTSSDDDSVSLLCGFTACRSSQAPEDMEVTDFNLPAGSKEEKRDLEEHQVEPPESVTSPLSQRSSRGPKAAAQPGNRSENQRIA